MANHHVPPLVSGEQFELIVDVFAALRKKPEQRHPTAQQMTEARRDMTDALDALQISGYVLIPKGTLDALRKLL